MTNDTQQLSLFPEHDIAPLPLEGQAITEAEHGDACDEWFNRARDITLETLPVFCSKLQTYQHDYGTIVRAVAAASVAAAWAMNKGPSGGITGFQASAVMWEFITHWMPQYFGAPLRLVNYDDMLYPQYEHKFQKTLRKDMFHDIQEKARKLLADESHAHEDVRAHWQSIVEGEVPFGYKLRD